MLHDAERLGYWVYSHDHGTVVDVEDTLCVICNVEVTVSECDDDLVRWQVHVHVSDGFVPAHRACLVRRYGLQDRAL